MKGRVKVKYINSEKGLCELDISVLGRVTFVPGEPKQTHPLIPPSVRDEAADIMIKLLGDILQPGGITIPEYRVESRGLDTLTHIHAVPEKESLACLLAWAVLRALLDEFGLKVEFDEPIDCSKRGEAIRKLAEVFGPHLKQNRRMLKNSLLEASGVVDKFLIRAGQLEKERRYRDALDLISGIETGGLNRVEKVRYDLLRFSLLARSKTLPREEVEKLFEELTGKYASDTESVLFLWFEFIRYLEDIREYRAAGRQTKIFEERFSLRALSREQEAVYLYVKGRALYYSGEYVQALDQLNRAYGIVGEDAPETRAAVLNTAANCFVDTLYFDRGRAMGETALSIRRELRLPAEADSISLLGGVFFKEARFEEAYDCFRRSHESLLEVDPRGSELNRSCNYLAKTCVQLGRFPEAEDYLSRAEEHAAGDPKKQSFTRLYRLNMLYLLGDFSGVEKMFRDSFLLPENHVAYDQFCLGWGYTLQAYSCFRGGRPGDGFRYLLRSIRFFYDDSYFLESVFVLLKAFLYDVPAEERELLGQHDTVKAALERFSRYVTNHANLLTRYFSAFPSGPSEPPGEIRRWIFEDILGLLDLETLGEKKEEIAKIAEGVCLM